MKTKYIIIPTCRSCITNKKTGFIEHYALRKPIIGRINTMFIPRHIIINVLNGWLSWRYLYTNHWKTLNFHQFIRTENSDSINDVSACQISISDVCRRLVYELITYITAIFAIASNSGNTIYVSLISHGVRVFAVTNVPH